MPADRRFNDVLATYRYLRVAMIILALTLAAAVVRQIFQQDQHCWLGSISAYYYTSARAVFVACLCAIGAALIVYHGNSSREDVALNVSGFLAFVVAFVPTPLRDLTVRPSDAICRLSNVPTEAQLVKAIENNLFALLVGGTLVVLAAWGFWYLAPDTGRVGSLDLRLIIGSSIAMAVAWVVLWGSPGWTRGHAHLYAAVALFAGIVLVILMNAWEVFRGPAEQPTPGYERAYRIVAVAMVAGAALLGALALSNALDHTVFWLESLGIAGFIVFWAIQTRELWDVTSRGTTVEQRPLAMDETAGSR